MKGKITMEELVYRAIKNKLDNIQLSKPEIDDLILFLIYEIKAYETDEKKNLDRIYNDLIDKYERGAITSLDLKDVIYNK